MAYIDTEYIYGLFEDGIAHLHVTDIDQLPRLNMYKCYIEFDNGATITDRVVIVFAENEDHAKTIANNILCKHNDDSINSIKVEKFTIEIGDGFEINK